MHGVKQRSLTGSSGCSAEDGRPDPICVGEADHFRAGRGSLHIDAHGWMEASVAGRAVASLVGTPCLPEDRPPDIVAIGIAEVLSVLEPIWHAKAETASKVRGRIELILAWAYQRNGTDRLNPARWQGHLDTQLPARGRVAVPRHHTALPVAEMSRFMKALSAVKGGGARALEFTILTAARPGEARLARWPEIDFASTTWVVPAERMKGGHEHRVPLSSAAIALLESTSIVDSDDTIFQSTQGGGGAISNMTMLKVCQPMGEDCVPHGFVSTFRDWSAECTDVASEVAEMALAHWVGNAVEPAYRRGDLLEKRRSLMEAWSTFLTTGTSASAVTLSGPRRVRPN